MALPGPAARRRFCLPVFLCLFGAALAGGGSAPCHSASVPVLQGVCVQPAGADGEHVLLRANQPLVYTYKVQGPVLHLVLHHPEFRLHMPTSGPLESVWATGYQLCRYPGDKAGIRFQGKRAPEVVSVRSTTGPDGQCTLTVHVRTTDPQTSAPDFALRAPRHRPVIVIDPGHGGHDPGSDGPEGLTEKEITLQTARTLKRVLSQGGLYRVILTRKNDRALSLDDRVVMAQKKKADLFISLHADSHPDPSTRGMSVYVVSEKPSDRKALLLALRENRAHQLAARTQVRDRKVISILQDLEARETVRRSQDLAGHLIQAMSEHFVMLRDTPGSGAFRVLQSRAVPSMLVEMGCLSHPEEARELASRARQELFARTFRQVLEAWFRSEHTSRRPEGA